MAFRRSAMPRHFSAKTPALLLSACLASALAGACAPPTGSRQIADRSYAELYNALSEDGGFFDSDNLISNETSYLHALDDLRAYGVRGGVFIGVGPDQGFSYIAEIRPELAIMIDIRRDAMLQHLMFRALFRHSRNRMEYLAGLIGAQVFNLDAWTGRPIDEIVAVLDTAQRTEAEFTRWSSLILGDASASGIALEAKDVSTIQRFRREFFSSGLSLRYTSHNRPPRLSYPTLRQLITERDLAGNQSSYLATEDRWRIVRDLQLRNRVLVVTGDLAGPHAIRAIGDYLRTNGLTVSAFYTSNVEQYLFQFGTFEDFAGNTAALPFAPNGVIIRSFFNRAGWHPRAQPGHISVQLVQPAAEFLQKIETGGYGSYFELVN
ncbi:MAG TPA: hypothetical protein VIL32_01545 [Steroidobacteraceae bacterium]